MNFVINLMIVFNNVDTTNRRKIKTTTIQEEIIKKLKNKF